MKNFILAALLLTTFAVYAQDTIPRKFGGSPDELPEPFCMTCNGLLSELPYADVYMFLRDKWLKMPIEVVFAFTNGYKPGLIDVSTLTMTEDQIKKTLDSTDAFLEGPYNYFITNGINNYILVIANKDQNGKVTTKRMELFNWRVTIENIPAKSGRLFVPKKQAIKT